MPLTPDPNTLGGRILQLMRDKGLKINATARTIGLSGQGLRDILSGDSENPGTGVIIKLARLLEVSTDWLLLGQQPSGGFSGYELAEGGSSYGRRAPAQPLVPVVHLGAQSAFITANCDLSQVSGLQQLMLPELVRPDAELIAFEVEDHALAPDIRQGSIVITAPERDNWRFLPSGQVFVALFGGRLWVRRLYFMQEENAIELRGSGDLPPVRVSLNEVIRLWRVRLTLSRL